MAEISIIVPVYKVEKYIYRCVDSILKQSFNNYELILVDDGSPDNCGNICDDYSKKDKRIHVIHQTNQGLSAARNAGIVWAFSNSDSRWLTFIDSDDWIHPRYLAVLYNAANKFDTDVAIGNALWTSDGVLPDKIYDEPELWKIREYYMKDPVNATVAWGKLYKKECFSTIRYPVGKIHEDEFVTYRILFEKEYVAVVDQPLYGYFWNTEGITKQRWSLKRLDQIEGVEGQVPYFINKGYFEIAEHNFRGLCYLLADNQDAILKAEGLSRREKRYYIRMLIKKLRYYLLQYRKYNWVTVINERSLYARASLTLSLLRRLWLRVKPYVRRFKLTVRRTIRFVQYALMIRSYNSVLLQSPLHGNLGDQAIAQSELELLKEMNVSVLDFPWTYGIEKMCAKVTPKKVTIFIHGGGYLGQLWPVEDARFLREIQAFRKNKIIVFPQTIYYDVKTEEGQELARKAKKIYESHPDLTLFLREKYSYNFIKRYMPNVHAELVPDIVMNLKVPNVQKMRKGLLVCLRNDIEKTMTRFERDKLLRTACNYFSEVRFTDTVLDADILPESREVALQSILTEFSSAKVVITDRLHGMIFSAITETPCIVINSLSYKVKGCYEWLKQLDYIRFLDDYDLLQSQINEVENSSPKYCRENIESLMQPLINTIMKS